MSSVPIEPEPRDPSTEELLERIRVGLRAENELIRHYLEVYRPENPVVPALLLKAMYHKSAEKMGTDVFDVICRLFADRFEEIAERLQVFATTESLEADIEGRVRRELGKLRKQLERAPRPGGPLLEGVDGKGYAPATPGDAHSSILFRTYNEKLESAINKVQRDDDSQQTFYRVLARLYVLKKWTYEDLASLVFGPDQSEVDLVRNGERIRKWIKPAVRDLKSKKKQGSEPRATDPAQPPMNENTDIF